jgi:hypothetical protein
MDGINGNVFMPLSKTYIYKGDVFFSPPPTNEIINMSDNTVFSWNFGDKNNSLKKINKLRRLIKSEGEIPKRDYIGEGMMNYSIIYNYETSKYRICLLNCGHFKFKHVFLDKEAQKAVVFEKTTENMQFILPDFCGESMILYESSLIDLPFYDKENLSKEQNAIINSNNPETDNPFIIKYNFKKMK